MTDKGLKSSDSPLVSCIINFLNGEKYLNEAIDCILAQTYSNWELLLVDDGSSDGSAAIAASYCFAQPERIRYLSHPQRENRGTSASRNLGVQNALGVLVAFLDADDAWSLDKLERQVSLFREHPEAVMVCGATLYWHSWQGSKSADELIFTGDVQRQGRWVRSLEQDHLYKTGELLGLLYPLGEGMTPSLSGIIVKRNAVVSTGGFENEFRNLFDDQVFRAKAYVAGPIYVSSLCFDRYRQHSQSCTHVMRGSSEARELRRRYLRWLRTYLREVGVHDLRWKLRKAMLRCDHPKLYHVISKFVRTLRALAIWRSSQVELR